jgi:hypothetical protein
MNVQMSQSKIPQTDNGVTLIVAAIESACENAVNIGFLAPGTWTGAAVQTLNTGDTLTSGYKIMAGSIANQSATDITARNAPPIYVCIKLAGSIECVTIVVNVNE